MLRGAGGFGAALAVSMLLAVAPAAATTLDPVSAGVPGGGRAWELVTPADPVSARPDFGPWTTPDEVAGYADFYPEAIAQAISPSGDRLVFKAAGSLPDAQHGVLISYNVAERSAEGWSSRTMPYPLPQFNSVSADIFNEEGALAFNDAVTETVWKNAYTAPAEPGVNGDAGLFRGSLSPPYTEVATAIGRSPLFAGASADLDHLYISSNEHLLPADAGRPDGPFSIYEIDGTGVHLVDVKEDGSLISDCGSIFRGIVRKSNEVLFASNPDCGSFSHIYLRAGGHVTDVSASQCTLADCGPEANADYLGVSADGSSVFFASSQRLTNADNEGEQMLYRYDVASGTLSEVFQQPPGPEAVIGQVHTSADGSRVYFVASLPVPLGQEPALGLYLADGSGLHLVAPSPAGEFFVSADGRYVVYSTPSALDPGDTDSSADIYRYDADSGTNTLVSGGSGGRGNGAIPIGVHATRAVDGDRRVFFTTAEALLPEDRNENYDAYEWTEAGLHLISGGVPGIPAYFIGATSDGSTAFFTTAATLLPRDRDSGDVDIYAARIGGGQPEPAEPTPSGCSECGGGPDATVPKRSPIAGGAPPRRLEVGPIDAAARRQLARTGATTLVVEAPTAGRLTVVGRGKGKRPLAGGSAPAKAPGPLALKLRLRPAARKALERGKPLRLRLFISLGSARTDGPTLVLKPAAAT